MKTLVVTNLSKKIGSKKILEHISLSVTTNEIVALLGPNGAGKTTLLKTIIGLHHTPAVENVTENIISWDGTIINQFSACRRVSLGLAYLPQHTSLFQELSVEENLELVFEYQEYWNKKNRSLFLHERDEWLSYTSLSSTLKQSAKTLSGGQKRKLEVARTLLMHPSIIMLDEPFAGVDPKSIYELKDIFQKIKNDNIGIIISDHHVDQLLSIATRTYVIVQGAVVTSGSIEDILNCSYTKERYLGTQFYNEITERHLSNHPKS